MPARPSASAPRRPADTLRTALAALRHPISQNAMALYAVQFVLTILPMITLPWLARKLGPQELGQVVFVQSFSFLLGMLVEYGFALSATRRVARQRDDREARGATVAGVLGAKLSLMGLTAVGALLALAVVPSFRADPRLLAFGWAMAVLQGINPSWYFAGLERMRLMAGVDVGVRLAGAVAIVLTVRHAGEGLRVLWIWTVGNAVAALVLTVLMYRDVPMRRPTRAGRKLALQEGWALFVGTAAVSLYTSGTVFMLGLVVSSAQLALFASAERVARAAIRATGPLSAAAYPRISALVAASRERAAQRVASLAMLGLAGIGVLTGAGLIALAPEIVRILFGDRFAGATGLLRTLALLVPLVAVAGSLSSLWLLTRGIDRPGTYVALAAGGVNVVLTPLIGTLLGVHGVAWTLVAIESGCVIALTAIIRRRGLLPRRGVVRA